MIYSKSSYKFSNFYNLESPFARVVNPESDKKIPLAKRFRLTKLTF